MKIRLACLSLLFSLSAFAADVPGGLTQTGDILPTNTFEMLLSPTYTLSPAPGAYLSSQIRYQPNEDFGAGFGFGAGEVGFNFGINGTWYIAPDMGAQPAVALLGGLYLNRFLGESFFVMKVAPMVSKQVHAPWGKITPYGGLHIAPTFRLGEARNELSMRASAGTQVEVAAMGGVRMWAEVGVGLAKSVDEIVLGLSYPFAAL